MALIQWQEGLSVGITSIDDQHKKLINMINSLNDSIKQGNGKSVTGQVLEDLVVYTTEHFAYEEELFAKYGYAGTEEHVKKHHALLNTVGELKSKYDVGDVEISDETMAFLKSWLTKHIMGTDQTYSEFLIANGVK